jgi:hypothetical protein
MPGYYKDKETGKRELVIEITVGIALAAVILDNLDIILPIVDMGICAYTERDGEDS